MKYRQRMQFMWDQLLNLDDLVSFLLQELQERSDVRQESESPSQQGFNVISDPVLKCILEAYRTNLSKVKVLALEDTEWKSEL